MFAHLEPEERGCAVRRWVGGEARGQGKKLADREGFEPSVPPRPIKARIS